MSIQPALKNRRKDGHLFRRSRDREASFPRTQEDYDIPIAALFDELPQRNNRMTEMSWDNAKGKEKKEGVTS